MKLSFFLLPVLSASAAINSDVDDLDLESLMDAFEDMDAGADLPTALDEAAPSLSANRRRRCAVGKRRVG